MTHNIREIPMKKKEKKTPFRLLCMRHTHTHTATRVKIIKHDHHVKNSDDY